MWYAATFSCRGTYLTFQTAAAKGLVAGNFSIVHEDGTRVEGLGEKEVGGPGIEKNSTNLLTRIKGMLVPTLSDSDRLDLTPVRWILVIEKEV